MPNKKTAAQAWAEWAAAVKLSEPQPEPQPEPAEDNRPAPLPSGDMTPRRTAADAFSDFMDERFRAFY